MESGRIKSNSSFVLSSFTPLSELEKKLPIDIWVKIISHLKPAERTDYAKCSKFSAMVIKQLNQRDHDLVELLRKQIESLQKGYPLDHPDIQRVLLKLVTSPIVRNNKWASLFRKFIRELIKSNIPNQNVESVCKFHKKISEILAKTEEPLSFDQTYDCCKEMGIQIMTEHEFSSFDLLSFKNEYSSNEKLNKRAINQAFEDLSRGAYWGSVYMRIPAELRKEVPLHTIIIDSRSSPNVMTGWKIEQQQKKILDYLEKVKLSVDEHMRKFI